jgi:ubiquinone/menaquinone biosynthesis C-methylase UbiE
MTNKNAITIDKTRDLLDNFIALSKSIAKKHPALVVILMHEYFRNLYPHDPYIQEKYSRDPLSNIYLCLQNNIDAIKVFKNLGSYYPDVSSIKFNNKVTDDIETMSNLFGSLWQKRFDEKVLNSEKVINDLFTANQLNLAQLIKDKNVIDIGCGSGRFSIALSKMGAKKVTAIDINPKGIEIAKKFSQSSNISNIEFIEHNVLDLPFDNESFDFVFSKGVLHHTGDLEKGIEEYSRVLRKGGCGFLYLYANGGIYWNSRDKMREVMKLIPMDFTIKVLDSIGMPSRRTIFVDSWYVPVEDYVKSEFIEKKFSNLGYENIFRMKSNRSFELDKIVLENGKWAEDLWGEGELRYLLTK